MTTENIKDAAGAHASNSDNEQDVTAHSAPTDVFFSCRDLNYV